MKPPCCKSTLFFGQDPERRDDEQAVNAALEKTYVLTVPECAPRSRLDAFLGEALRADGISREKIKQAIADGRVKLNGKVRRKANSRIERGDEVAATLPNPEQRIYAEQGELSVLWSDEHIAVLNKPAGLTVHPAPGVSTGTLAHRLLHRFPELAAQGGLRPGIVHRLDKDTSGLLLVALTEKARLALSAAFAERRIQKRYLALLCGVPEKSAASVAAPIGRDLANKTKMAVAPLEKGGKEAHSDYETLYGDPAGKFSMVRVALHTGRTHQIRVHMRHLGHPLIGDAVYATNKRQTACAAKRQMLHAWKLSFLHPETGEKLSFCTPPPEDFCSAATILATPMQRVIVTGSPGCGKSTLVRSLQAAGMPCWSADETVRGLYVKGGDGWYLLQRRYGRRFVPNENADVDKKKLFAAMTASEQIRTDVEHLIHPLVLHDLNVFWKNCEANNTAAAVAEIPLYLESGWRDAAKRPGAPKEILVAVYCPFEERAERMKRTRGWNYETIATMEAWQWPEDAKIRAADLILDNSGNADALSRRSKKLVAVLTGLQKAERERARARFETLWQC